mgnify:CR=1 FL=1
MGCIVVEIDLHGGLGRWRAIEAQTTQQVFASAYWSHETHDTLLSSLMTDVGSVLVYVTEDGSLILCSLRCSG